MPQARKAKRVKGSTTAVAQTWILLDDAIELIAEAYKMARSSTPTLWRGRYPAEDMLDVAVRAGDVPAQYKRFEGKRYVSGGEDYYEPWIEDLPSLADAWEHGRIHTRLSSIYLIVPDKGFGTFYRVEVGLEAVRKLLPKGYELPAPAATLAAPEPTPDSLKPGRKPFLWEAFRLRANRLLDTRPDLRDDAGKLASQLEVWGIDSFGADNTPSIDTMRKRTPEWLKGWRLLHG